MQELRIPRPLEAPRRWVSAGILVAVLAGVASGLTGNHHPAAPASAAAAASQPLGVRAGDVVDPQPIDISFASPAPAPAPAPRTAPRVARTRPLAPLRRTAPAPAAAPVDSTCTGAGWQQRRGEQALGSLLHAVPAGVTVSFLPSRGGLKGMTYYDTHHVDVFVGSCGAESSALLRHVVAHEMGHAWDSAHMTDALRAQYLAARGIKAGTPWFGCNGCQDFATPAGDFAETYAQWQRGASDSRSTIARPATAAELSSLGAQFFS